MTNKEKLDSMDRFDCIGITYANLRPKARRMSDFCIMDAFKEDEIGEGDCIGKCGECIQRWLDTEYDGTWAKHDGRW